MVKYKLYYFPIRGRAEAIRLVFAYAGIEYEDVRIPMDKWPEHKSSMPMGQMPVLEVDGVKYSQSGPILRYLAKKNNLAGKTDGDAYWADVFMDVLDDIGKQYPRQSSVGPEKMEELKKEFFNVTAKEGLQKVEKLYKEHNKGKNCYLVGEEPTYADLIFITYMDFLLPQKPDLFAGLPGLEGVYNRVREISKIKAWIEKRPNTEY